MTTLNVYLSFNGNCEEAFHFYREVFGGSFSYKSTFGEMPPSDEVILPASEKNKILHIALPISQETILMGSDTTPYSGDVHFGDNFSISVSSDNRPEADRIFTALSAGGKVIMPLADAFWGAYFGMLTDKFGIKWMVNVEPENQN